MQDLPQTLNLTPYLKIFCDEGIDGQLFSECGEHILHELSISRATRAQLMKIISGSLSAVDILEGGTQAKH